MCSIGQGPQPPLALFSGGGERWGHTLLKAAGAGVTGEGLSTAVQIAADLVVWSWSNNVVVD